MMTDNVIVPRELLPCPFCSGEARLDQRTTQSLWNSSDAVFSHVACDECDISGQDFCDDPNGEEASEWWNRRARPAGAQHEWEIAELIDQRDNAEDWANELSAAIASHTGAYIGEHSNMNCPWANALEAIQNTRPSQAEQQPVAEVLWPDEPGRRGGFSQIGHYDDPRLPVGTKLYVAPIAQTAPQPEHSGLVAEIDEALAVWSDGPLTCLLRKVRASLNATQREPGPTCARCGGSGVVDDGEIDCYPNGEPYENGPMQCVKDCPACASSKSEPAPAQDEREESAEALFEHYLQSAIDNAPEPLRRLGEHLSHVLDEDRWATAERLLNGAIVALTRPAQTEQKPVAWRDEAGNLYPSRESIEKYLPEGRIATPLYAVPVTHADPSDECEGCQWCLIDMYGEIGRCCKVVPSRPEQIRLVEALEYCEAWFARHSPASPLIGGYGGAEHPMLTCIRAALAAHKAGGSA